MSLSMAQLVNDHQEMTWVMLEVWKIVSQRTNSPTEYTELFIQVTSENPEIPLTGEALFKALQSRFPGQLYGIDVEGIASAIIARLQ